ncbi:MAG: histidine phosphatase family protein [Anaerolineales bacterium]|nr:histidine phosphatase family protein [Anaerolineales bacterium]
MSHTHHLTLLRHGESEGNILNLFIGQDDYSLTANGRLQAQALAQLWAQENQTFDAIIASPLKRAQQTAHAVAEALHLPVETEPLWMEQDYGEWNKLSIPEILRDPATPKYYTPYDRPGHTGESRIETYLRAGQALHALLDRPPGRYLVVAHGVILNMALYFALGIPCHPSSEGPWFAFHHTSHATLTYSPERYRWQLVRVNDHRHLPEPPPVNDPGSFQIMFVRHAESEGNANGLWQGQAEFPLSETGRTQAQALADYLANREEKFDQIIASPLTRAHDTAQAVAKKFALPVETDPLWLERDNGQWAGSTPENRYPPEPDYLFLHHPVGGTGETEWDLYLRGGKAIANLLNRPPGRYFVASHGGILNMALKVALGISPFPNHQGARFAFGNTAICRVTYLPARNRWLITALNDLAHLHATNQQVSDTAQKIQMLVAREQLE